MAGKYDRFLNLERARKPVGEEAPRVQRAERFLVLQPDGRPLTAGCLSPSHAARFREDLALAERTDEQPFVRCGRCEADSVRHATVCSRCRAPLDTPEQRAFNAELWSRMRAAREEEARAGAAGWVIGGGGAPGESDGVARRAAGSSESGGGTRGNRLRRREARAASAVVALAAILLVSGGGRWWMAPGILLAIGAFLLFGRYDALGRIWRRVRSGTG